MEPLVNYWFTNNRTSCSDSNKLTALSGYLQPAKTDSISFLHQNICGIKISMCFFKFRWSASHQTFPACQSTIWPLNILTYFSFLVMSQYRPTDLSWDKKKVYVFLLSQSQNFKLLMFLDFVMSRFVTLQLSSSSSTLPKLSFITIYGLPINDFQLCFFFLYLNKLFRVLII